MINLLSHETKRQILAARTNVILRNYCVMLLIMALALGGIFGAGWVVTLQDKTTAKTLQEASEAAAVRYSTTRKSAQNFAKDLTVAKNILSHDVSFHYLLIEIAAIVPKNVILSNLSLTSTAAITPVDISARAKTSQDAIALKNSLETSEIFQNVSIVNINQADPASVSQADPVTQKYPFAVNLKVEFTKTAKATGP